MLVQIICRLGVLALQFQGYTQTDSLRKDESKKKCNFFSKNQIFGF